MAIDRDTAQRFAELERRVDRLEGKPEPEPEPVPEPTQPVEMTSAELEAFRQFQAAQAAAQTAPPGGGPHIFEPKTAQPTP